MKAEVSELRHCVDHIENKMGEYASVYNELADAHNENDEEIAALKAKLTDLKDRSRKNNVKFRGASETDIYLKMCLEMSMPKFIFTM